jgi:hypothetical protein
MTHGNTIRNRAVKADVQRVRVGRKFWLFTFSERWGPSLCNEWAEPVNNMPLADEEHPFWDAFETWLAALHHHQEPGERT